MNLTREETTSTAYTITFTEDEFALFRLLAYYKEEVSDAVVTEDAFHSPTYSTHTVAQFLEFMEKLDLTVDEYAPSAEIANLRTEKENG